MTAWWGAHSRRTHSILDLMPTERETRGETTHRRLPHGWPNGQRKNQRLVRFVTLILALALFPIVGSPAQAAAPGFHSKWVGQSDYLKMQPGQTTTFWIKFLNTGTEPWVRGVWGRQANLGLNGDNKEPYRLGMNYNWLWDDRIATTVTPIVNPGEIGEFQFGFRAPMAPGTYYLNLRPVIDGTVWMEDEGVFWIVEVASRRVITVVDVGGAATPSSGFGQSSFGWGAVLRNESTAEIALSLSINATFYGASGQVLGTDNKYINSLAPSELVTVGDSTYLSSSANLVTRVTASVVSGGWTTGGRVVRFGLESPNYIPSSCCAQISGIITNPDATDHRFVIVSAVGRDATGKIVGGGSTYIDVAARATQGFTLYYEGAAPASVNLFAGLSLSGP
jgi:hypothetical protein